jgi:cGMP-dependent protein kinase
MLGSLLLGIEYLHSRKIVYRDLKPENVMVDCTGHLKIIDLGTAKVLSEKNSFKTYTMVGTPHYMAPEIFTGKGHNFMVDLWSLGIPSFEARCHAL